MSYIFRRRLSLPLNDLTRAIRDEIYVKPYSSYVFSEHRNTVAPEDMYNPHTTLLNILNWIITQYEKFCVPTRFSDAALKRVWELICHEDDNTDFLCVGPVNNVIHLLAVYYHEGKGSHRYNRHVDRLSDFMWVGKDGMMMNGTNGVQLWDTAFTVSAAFEADLAGDKEFIPCLTKALEFIDDMQVSRYLTKINLRFLRMSRKKRIVINAKEHGHFQLAIKDIRYQIVQQKDFEQFSSSKIIQRTLNESMTPVSKMLLTYYYRFKMVMEDSLPTNLPVEENGWNGLIQLKYSEESW